MVYRWYMYICTNRYTNTHTHIHHHTYMQRYIHQPSCNSIAKPAWLSALIVCRIGIFLTRPLSIWCSSGELHERKVLYVSEETSRCKCSSGCKARRSHCRLTGNCNVSGSLHIFWMALGDPASQWWSPLKLSSPVPSLNVSYGLVVGAIWCIAVVKKKRELPVNNNELCFDNTMMPQISGKKCSMLHRIALSAILSIDHWVDWPMQSPGVHIKMIVVMDVKNRKSLVGL